ncbi:MAG TPA: hypothetical protein VFU05_17915 [Cyclobacteriaceae bacterium]|nr:hypothetical protein [Cyclobacteriaceae bacterium]
MLLEKFLPTYHFSERHTILISAPPSSISKQLAELSASDSWIIKILLTLRGIPPKTSTGIEGWKKMGFVVLEHQPDKEIILGLVGQFWKSRGNIQSVKAEEFVSFNPDGFVKAVWNFKIIPADGKQLMVETETRVFCTNENVRRKFGRYWFFIRPFSGLIRTEMLKIIKRKAERDS